MRTQQGEFETDFAIYYVFLTPLTNLLADSLPYMQIQAYRPGPVGWTQVQPGMPSLQPSLLIYFPASLKHLCVWLDCQLT